MGQVQCPLCTNKTSPPLWSVRNLELKDKVALRLMDADKVCVSCWERCVREMEHEMVIDLSTSLMDELASLHETNEEMEEEKDAEIEQLKDQNNDLRESLEELQNRISDALR